MIVLQHMLSYDSTDLSSAAPLRTAAHSTQTIFLPCLPVQSSPSLVHVKLEPPHIKEEQQERSPGLVQVKLEPPQIKEEPEEVLLRPEQASGSTFTVKTENDDENREREPPASTSTEHMKTQAYTEYWVPSQPTSDDQLLFSHSSESDTEDTVECETFSEPPASTSTEHGSESDTEDSDEWETFWESFSSTLKEQKKRRKRRGSCRVCGKVMKIAIMRRHMMIHTGEKPDKPFACTVCSKIFSLSNLQRHMNSQGRCAQRQFFHTKKTVCKVLHSGGNSFVCKICSKSLKDSGKLNNHMRIHTKKKPFACPVCEKRFKGNASLELHMKTHTESKSITYSYSLRKRKRKCY